MNYAKARTFNQARTLSPAAHHALRSAIGRDVTAWTDADLDAVAAWQAKSGLTPDGMIGAKSLAVLLPLPTTKSIRVPTDISITRTLFAAAAMLWFIDVSTHQTVTSWRKVGESCDGVVIKSGQGESGIDDKCDMHVAGARAAGVKVLALYHYAQHFGRAAFAKRPSCPKENARNLATACRHYGVKWGILDLEPDEVDDAIEKGWGAADFEAWSRAFVAEFSTFKDLKLAVYLSGETIKRSRAGARSGGFDWLRDAGLPLWWAGYLGADESRPETWGPPRGHLTGWPLDAAHQYRGGDNKKTKGDEGGKCPGVVGDVDNNCAPRDGWAGEMWRDAA